MKCTDCHRSIAPVVGLDLDDTLCLYSVRLIRFANSWTQAFIPGREHLYRDAALFDGSQELSEFLGMTKHEYRQMKLAYRQGGGKRTQPYRPGAAMLTKSLRAAGAEVWITTTRPYQRFDSTDPDTRFSLEAHGIEYDHLLYDDDKYRVLAETVGSERVVAVLDDLPENYDRAEELGLNPYLLRTATNQAHTRERELYHLPDVAFQFARIVRSFNHG